MTQIIQKTENKTVTWNANLRSRVGDSVTHNSKEYTNLTGKNSEPGVGVDWFQTSVDGGGGGGSTLEEYGTVYEKYTFNDASDFVLEGDATAVASGGNLTISSVAPNGTFTDKIILNQVTGLDKFKITIRFKMTVPKAATTYGVGLGLMSTNVNTFYQFTGRVNFDNTTNRLLFATSSGSVYTNKINDTGNPFVNSVGDLIELSVEQDRASVKTKVKNLSRNIDTVNDIEYLYTTNTVNGTMPNVGRFCIYMLGGTYELQSMRVDSKEYKNSKLMTIGDSKTEGYTADSLDSCFSSLLDEKYKGVANNSGGYETTADTLTKVSEIIAFSPKKVLLNIGSNDKRTGIPFGTWQTNYDSITSQLVTSGADVYHLLQFNEAGLNFADYNLHITNTYPAGRIVDAGVVSLAVDGVHPDQDGHFEIFEAIVSQIGDLIK